MADDKALSLLGLARKAGKLKYGFEATAESISGRGACLVVVAKDISAKTLKEVKYLADKNGAEYLVLNAGQNDIERKTGRRAGVLAVTDGHLASAVKQAVIAAEFRAPANEEEN